jgi:hypothetical protein
LNGWRKKVNNSEPASFANIAFDTGVIAERERIIKALEEDGERYYISQETFDYVVAIVKGENK